MAEVTIRTTLEGFEEAARSFDKFNKQIQQVAESAEKTGKATKEAGKGMEEMSGATATVSRLFSSVVGRIITVTGAFELLRRGFSASIGQAVEAEQTMIRFNAVLAATGNVVGLTAAQFDQMAESMKESTRFDDTGIKRAMTVLLTFDRVQGETFGNALKISADLAEMWNLDLSSAARLVGRALQSPEHGLGMLGRMIGRLRPEQERMIKLFMEQGKVSEAQGVLLDAFRQKHGNLAQQMATSSTAGFQTFGRAVKEAAQELGKFLIPDTSRLRILEGWLKKLTDIMRGPTEREKRSLELDDRAAAMREIIAAEWTSVDEKRRASIELEQIERQQLALSKEIIGERAAAEKSAREAKSVADKEAAEQAAGREFKLQMGALDLQIDIDRRRLQERVAMIDARIAAMKKETQEERTELQTLLKLRQQTNDDIIKLTMEEFDFEIKTGDALLEDKLEFIRQVLAEQTISHELRMAMLKAEADTELEILEKLKKAAAEYAAAITATFQEQVDAADEYITMWNSVGQRVELTREEFEELNATVKRLEDPIKEYQREIERINKALELNRITQDEATEGVRRAKKAYEDAKDSAGEWSDWQKEMIRVTQDFGREFTDLIVASLNGAETAWSDFRDALKRMFQRTIIDQFITKPLEEALNEMIKIIRRKAIEASASGGSFWETVFGSSIGGAISGFFSGGGAVEGASAAAPQIPLPEVRPLQHGGILPRGFTGLVGEAGPEFVVPAGSSRVIPNDALGGGSIVINQTFQAGVSRAELAQILPQLSAQTIAGVMEAKQRGGRFSKVFSR